MRRPIAIDLFAGAGGLSLGFEQAGFDVVAAVEIDPVHAAIHKFNFPNCAVIAQSITMVSGDLLRKKASIGESEIDVVCGGAPCQGFSLIGHRALDDDRNLLVREFLRVVKELRPKFFVFENVKGLTVGKHRTFLDELIEEFEEIGYSIRKPWRVLNAKNYGVPQDRERLFLFGARAGFEIPIYPEAITGSPTCFDALNDVPDIENFEELFRTDEVQSCVWGFPSAYARKLRGLDNASWHLGYPRNWAPSVLTSSMRTHHSEISVRRFGETAQGSVEPISRFFKLSATGVSNTLRAGTDSARGAFTSPRPIHYSYPRCVTVREMARLHSFPDWFRFHETKWHGARQIGNSVPPLLALAVASSVLSALGAAPERPSIALDLGDAKLLRMDMSKAAAFWNVENPIGRRDRKSGAKKRKQAEIEAEFIAAKMGSHA
jgi:DNA (cytosine-5)-methyltransferase 1